MNGGTHTTLLAPHPDRKTCEDCGATYYNVYAHKEECSGPARAACLSPIAWDGRRFESRCRCGVILRASHRDLLDKERGYHARVHANRGDKW